MVKWFLTREPGPFSCEEQSFQQMVLGKLDIHMQKNEAGPLHYTILTQIKDLNVRITTIKLLEENTGEKLHYTGFGNDIFFFWIWHQKYRQQRKIDKLDYIKVKNLSESKDTIRVKRQHRMGKKKKKRMNKMNNRWMDKQNVEYNGTLFSLKKEGNSHTCYNMNEP